MMDHLPAILREQEELLGRIDRGEEEAFRRELEKAGRLFFTGAGRTMLMLRAMAMRLMQLGRTVYLAGDTNTPAIGPGDLLIAASASGETGSVLLNARKGLEAGARLAVLTASPASSLAALAHCRVWFPVAAEKGGGEGALSSFQPGGSAFEQCLLLWGDGLALSLLEELPEGSSVMTLHANLE